MTGIAVLDMLLGGALVAAGFLSAALADRIRGLRVSRERAPTSSREQVVRAVSARPAIGEVETARQDASSCRVECFQAPHVVGMMGKTRTSVEASQAPHVVGMMGKTRTSVEASQAPHVMGMVGKTGTSVDEKIDPIDPRLEPVVVAALVAAGYKRSFAVGAVQGVGPHERATIEGWTRAALRRCARGGAS